MQAFHDPIRQLNYIQQSLTHDKKPLGLFLSAGCGLAVRIKNGSADLPLIPDIVGLTEALADKLPVGSDARRVFDGISKQLKDDGLAAPNLEDILGHIRSLKLVAGGEKVRGFSAGELGDSDDLICKAIFELVNKTLPDKTTPHHSVASWIGAIPRSDPVSLFTTNYDLLFEQALEEIRVPYFDGFVGSRQTFFDPTRSNRTNFRLDGRVYGNCMAPSIGGRIRMEQYFAVGWKRAMAKDASSTLLISNTTKVEECHT